MVKKIKKLIRAEMFDDELFQNMLDTALNAVKTYDVPGFRSVEVDEELINIYGKEKTDWFHDTWDKI